MYRYNDTQVFASGAFGKLEEGIRASVERGGPATVFTTLDVRANERFGVRPYRARIHWVFLQAESEETGRSASRNWLNRIPCDSPVVRMFENQHPGLERFPNYRTFGENRGLRLWHVIRLKEEQVTLLAHYSGWTVASRGEELLEFIDPRQRSVGHAGPPRPLERRAD